ncbi:hypothetical protein MPH_08983 [Macrophomina phaseolina MS6]|uniref:Uncharacterized protein n=1 Tax=Macrophomina phaseolina (strain MS6) TaxID=1126212 RepID=K2QVT1_MACPH|nr:hypothetical protein MPH_08983 [Macrophomina phaseolina MS6]
MRYLDLEKDLLRRLVADHGITMATIHNDERRRTFIALRQKFKRMLLEGEAYLPPAPLPLGSLAETYRFLHSDTAPEAYTNIGANTQFPHHSFNSTTNVTAIDPALDTPSFGLGIMNLEPQNGGRIEQSLDSPTHRIADRNSEPSIANRTLPFPSQIIERMRGQRA